MTTVLAIGAVILIFLAGNRLGALDAAVTACGTKAAPVKLETQFSISRLIYYRVGCSDGRVVLADK